MRKMKPVRFIHLADVHLDTSFSGAGFPSRLGDRKREAIRLTFRQAIENARKQEVDFLLIAGDLFESDRITPDTVEFLKQQFESLKDIGVFIAPGNHDPFVQGSPYKEEAWPHNVHIFESEEFTSIELSNSGVRITGFGFNSAHLKDRHFRKLPVLPKEAVNIVISHGSDISRVPAGKSEYGPFTIDEIANKHIRYCALGHYHQQHRIPNSIDSTQVWYSGIPEGRGWDEEGPCGYLQCEIVENEVHVESCICNQYPLSSVIIDCDAFSSREQILDAILQQRGVKFDARTILRVYLEGSLDPRVDLSIPELESRLAEEALFIRWEDSTYPALDFGSLGQEKTIRGRFTHILNERIAASSEEERVLLERARLYGIQALNGREVRLK
jgi:exonuclease SbcD